VVLQSGVAPEQSAIVRQPTHVLLVVLQMGVAPEQFALVVQPTHTRRVGSHTGVLPPQSMLFRHATQRAVMVSHSGVGALHWLFIVQPRQVLVPTSHVSGAVHCGRSAVQAPMVHMPTVQPGPVHVVGLVQVMRFVPLQVPAQVPVPPHAVRGATGAPVTAEHVPTRPVSPQASHCPLHAVSQHTPSTQLPERH
jgi:hypothetical protein